MVALVRALDVLLELLGDVDSWDHGGDPRLLEHLPQEHRGPRVHLARDLLGPDAEGCACTEGLEADDSDIFPPCQLEQAVAAELPRQEEVREDDHGKLAIIL